MFDLPLALLAISSDTDRAALTELYLTYRSMFIRVARRYFGANDAEVEDAVAAAAERMCRFYDKILAVPRDKLPAYMVFIISNVCRDRIRKLQSERLRQAILTDQDAIERLPDGPDGMGTLFDRFNATELLGSFRQLSGHDKELIRMRHIDRYSIAEIAEELGMSKTAVSSALSRARARLETCAGSVRG